MIQSAKLYWLVALQESFEGEIIFDAPPPTGHKGDTLLHQLAAKKLIQDDGPGERKDNDCSEC